ncbi:1-acyl-sn-glycerol-3-phosphate acyltransferase [Helicobacter muridarum]|uniref:1-acyl-sn-glycerol-3-phosphate acyltransferase n=1 Tax=Helicobacter muridarum TaxID=216 RepID=A0A099TXW5_9HELI|nr:lysophospholipid acyltransferase family protein [Helicobacter muridarum]TLE00742.1 1-acyl-sn-glycerol-3-phosphate acyltransferase [Helicobacter muridarum]STQ86579.1 1-acyl-sn-glycerol-3-phosphate acyltransferase [Helicobacter muridarum]
MSVNKLKGYYATFLIIIGLATIICFMWVFRKNNGRATRKCCRLFFLFGGFKMEKIGEYDLNAKLIVANHQSASDIICLEGDHPLNICWVAKKQLGEIPFYGYSVKIPEMILIDREDKKGLIQLMREAKEKIAQNRPIIIFPEGTRGPGNRSFLPFKPGAKILAEKLGLRIQPIVFINTRKMYDSNPIYSQKNVARLVCMPSFVPEVGSDWYEKLEKDMFEYYSKHYNELNPEDLTQTEA